jgi:hypothetical protein
MQLKRHEFCLGVKGSNFERISSCGGLSLLPTAEVSYSPASHQQFSDAVVSSVMVLYVVYGVLS